MPVPRSTFISETDMDLQTMNMLIPMFILMRRAKRNIRLARQRAFDAWLSQEMESKNCNISGPSGSNTDGNNDRNKYLCNANDEDIGDDSDNISLSSMSSFSSSNNSLNEAGCGEDDVPKYTESH